MAAIKTEPFTDWSYDSWLVRNACSDDTLKENRFASPDQGPLQRNVIRKTAKRTVEKPKQTRRGNTIKVKKMRDVLSSWKKCVFKCDGCEFQTKCHKSLGFHRRAKHGGLSSSKLHHLQNFIVEGRTHLCKLCGQPIWQDPTALRLHLSARHRNLDLCMSAYFKLPTKKTTTFSRLGYQLKQCQIRLCKTLPEYNVKGLRKMVPTMPLDGTPKTNGRVMAKELCTNVIADLCVFKCDVCRYTTSSSKTLSSHRTKFHPVATKFAPQECISEARYHWCVLCLKGVLCDRSIMSSHLKWHGGKILTLAQYEVIAHKQVMYPHLVTGLLEPFTNKQYKGEKNKERKTNMQALVPTFPFIKMTLPPFYYPPESLTDVVENLCIFKCKNGCLETSDASIMIMHLKNCTGSGTITADSVKEARYFLCKRCQTQMICSKLIIRLHLKICSRSKKPYVPREKEKACIIDVKKCEVNVPRITFPSLCFEGLNENCVSRRNQQRAILAKKFVTEVDVSSEIDCRCLFSCKTCLQKFRTWKSASGHIIQRHNSFKTRRLVGIEKPAYHMCRVCCKLVLCDEDFIFDHVRGSHRVDKSLYEALEPSFQPPANTSVGLSPSDISLDCNSEPQVKPQKWIAVPLSRIPCDLTVQDAKDSCSFVCPKCQFRTKQFPVLMTHFAVTRHFRAAYNAAHVEVAKYYACKLCTSRVLCDTYIIASHIKGCHSKSEKVYQKLKRDDKDKRSCFQKIPNTTLKDLFLRQCVPKITEIDISGFKALSTLVPSALPKEKCTQKLGNLCTFRCTRCSWQASHWLSFKKHLTSCVGNMAFKEAHVVEARYHSCDICQARVLCDLKLVAAHLHTHKLSMSSYMDRLEKSGIDTDTVNFIKRRSVKGPI